MRPNPSSAGRTAHCSGASAATGRRRCSSRTSAGSSPWRASTTWSGRSSPGWTRGRGAGGPPERSPSCSRLVYAPAVQHRIGVMGGTFDPIHNGHLVAASEVANRFALDEVVFVPTGHPWQKDDRRVTSAEDRYLMTVIATASNPRFSVSRVDIDRDKVTYTVDTLRDLRAQHPDAELYFITGADALASILSWQNWAELFGLAKFVGVSRPGYHLGIEHLEEHLGSHPPDALTLVEVP